MRPRTENVPLQPEYGLNFAPSIMTATFSAWRYFREEISLALKMKIFYMVKALQTSRWRY